MKVYDLEEKQRVKLLSQFYDIYASFYNTKLKAGGKGRVHFCTTNKEHQDTIKELLMYYNINFYSRRTQIEVSYVKNLNILFSIIEKHIFRKKEDVQKFLKENKKQIKTNKDIYSTDKFINMELENRSQED